MIRSRIHRAFIATLFTVLGATISMQVHTAEPVQQDAFEEAAYSEQMQKLMDELHKSFAKARDTSIPQGEAEKARQAAFKTARRMLKIIDNRIHKLNIKEGGALSATDILVQSHVFTVVLDLLASEALPHEDKWEYIH